MTTQCCYCVPLKAGVVIISLIWLIFGIYIVTSNAINLTTPAKFDVSEPSLKNNVSSLNMFFISMIILYGLVTIGAAFGLFTITFANTPNMLIIYSKIAYGILVIEILSSIIGFVVIILFSSPILLTYLIVGTIFCVSISAHFAMVISAYAHKKEKKASAAKNDKQVDVSL